MTEPAVTLQLKDYAATPLPKLPNMESGGCVDLKPKDPNSNAPKYNLKITDDKMFLAWAQTIEMKHVVRSSMSEHEEKEIELAQGATAGGSGSGNAYNEYYNMMDYNDDKYIYGGNSDRSNVWYG